MHPGIRKAAVLVSGLDSSEADAVLDALGPEQAACVRDAMIALREIDTQEQRHVIDEFRRVGTMVPDKQPAGIELSDPPFCYLQETDVERLADVLADERPQTIALVLSQLPPERAGRVLAKLHGPLQVEVIHRLVDLEETDPEVLRDVDRALRSQLTPHFANGRRRVAGMDAVAEIIEAAGDRLSMKILDNLAEHDRALAERFCPAAVEFDDLARFDDATLLEIFRSVEPELMMTALIGAPPELIDRFTGCLPHHEAEALRVELDHPGPVRLNDVDAAREHIATFSRRACTQCN